MKNYTIICIGFLFIVSLLVASEIDGKWKGTLQGPNGNFDVFYTFKVVDDSLIGNVQTQWGTRDFFNGEVDSTSFSFDTEWNGMNMYHHCTMQGDSILMKMPNMNDGQEIKVILKKAK